MKKFFVAFTLLLGFLSTTFSQMPAYASTADTLKGTTAQAIPVDTLRLVVKAIMEAKSCDRLLSWYAGPAEAIHKRSWTATFMVDSTEYLVNVIRPFDTISSALYISLNDRVTFCDQSLDGAVDWSRSTDGQADSVSLESQLVFNETVRKVFTFFYPK